MSNSENNNDIVIFDSNAEDIIISASKGKILSQTEIDKLVEQYKESIDFLEKLKELNLEEKSFVIYNDGDDQLFYDDGEFYLLSVVDINKKRKKLKKQEAKDLYIEYFIKYQLNPIIKQRELSKPLKTVARNKVEPQKNTKEKVEISKTKSEEIKEIKPKEQPKIKKEDIVR